MGQWSEQGGVKRRRLQWVISWMRGNPFGTIAFPDQAMTEFQPDRIDPADGERFAQDLKKIRERQGVTLDDLYEKTKISLSILVDFEVNGLLGNPLFNSVYLRSLVRTYAESTGINPERALECLESALIGMYHGELSAEYLDDSASRRDVKRRSRKPTRNKESADGDRVATERGDTGRGESPPSPTVAKGISSVSGATQPTGSRQANAPGVVLPGSSVFTLLTSLGAVAVLAVCALLLWKVVTPSERADQPQTAKIIETPALQRAAPDQAVDSETEPLVSKPELGDKIKVEVLARGGALRPIRVRVDKDLRRPYWIDKDSVRTFSFTDQIVLEENLDLIALSVDGLDYPLGLNPGDRLVISRESVESFYETLPSR